MSSVLDDMPEAVEMARTAGRRTRRNGQADPDPEPEVGAAWAAQIAAQEAPATDEPPVGVEVAEGETATVTGDGSGYNPPDADQPEDLRPGAYQDPRQAILDIFGRRLEAVLQPVDDDDTWHGVFVITRKDLAEILQQPLPKASVFAAAVEASVWQPATIYVDAVCPRCGIAGEATITLRPQLLQGTETEIKLKAKTAPVPHACGQTRLRDLAPSRPTGQERLPLSSPVAPPADPDNADADVDDERFEGPELEDLGEPEVDQQALDLGSCPFPGCPLAAEHPGDHAPAEKSIESELDDALLPT